MGRVLPENRPGAWSELVGYPDTWIITGKVFRIAGHEHGVSAPCRRPNEGIGKPHAMSPTQAYRLSRGLEVYVNDLERFQEVLNLQLLFLSARADHGFRPTDDADALLLESLDLLSRFHDAGKVVDENVCIEQRPHRSPLTAEAALVGESVDTPAAPDSEGAPGFVAKTVPRVLGHRSPYRLRSRDLLTSAEFCQGLQMLFGKLDDGTHIIII